MLNSVGGQTIAFTLLHLASFLPLSTSTLYTQVLPQVSAYTRLKASLLIQKVRQPSISILLLTTLPYQIPASSKQV